MMLLRLLSWPYLRRHLLRWTLTLAGIVLGVAVFVAMHTANRSIFGAFDKTVDQIAGSTQLQVSAGEFGFDESFLERVQSVPEVGIAVPVIEATVETKIPGQGSILILGSDLTGDRNLRDYELKDADDAIIDDPLIFIAQPDSLMITKEFAERNKLEVNSRIPLLTIEGEKQFTVRGIMSSAGMAKAFGGNLAVMDIYAAQQVLGRGRRFDRIDLRAKDGVTVDQCQAALKAALGPGLEVEPPSARGRHFEALLQSYSTAMTISSLFALIVGMFIIYNSFSIAVTQRRSEIGILRALGATRGQIQRLFFLESIIAGLVGSGLGAAIGVAMALVVSTYMSAILEQAAGVAQRVTELSVDPKLIAILGRLYFRTSYGQNVLQHSIEMGHIAGMMAEELGGDVAIARAGALLHDIGKAVDHAVQGTHVEIGRRILAKFGVDERIIKAMQSHHEEYPYETLESIIVQTADAISGGRPGARRESVENYIKKLEDLEKIATSQPGVEKAYALAAGREVRVFVTPTEVNDLEAHAIGREIAIQIEKELKYPGEIKVTVIRETRVIEYAR